MPESDTLIVTVTYAYEQKVYPREGSGKVTGYERHFLAETQVALRTATRDEVEPVARLGFDHGGSFELVMHEGRLYRPLFAPGTHEPCDVADFVEAAKGIAPWRDSPFRDTERHYRSEETNGEPTPFRKHKDWFDPDAYRKVERDKRDEALVKLSAKVADLLVVDGVVHRPCREPVLVLKSPIDARTREPLSVRLAWSMDRLESDDDPFHGPTTVKIKGETSFGQRRADPYRYRAPAPPPPVERPVGPRSAWTARPWRVFGLVEAEEATRLGEALADETGVAFEVADDLATELRDWALAPPRRVPLARLANEAFGEVAGKLTKLSRDTINDWVDAREALAEKDVRGALHSLSNVLGRPEDSAKLRWKGTSRLAYDSLNLSYGSDENSSPDSEDAMAGLLRFHVVERHRVLAPGMDGADASALDGLEADGPGGDGEDEENEEDEDYAGPGGP